MQLDKDLKSPPKSSTGKPVELSFLGVCELVGLQLELFGSNQLPSSSVSPADLGKLAEIAESLATTKWVISVLDENPLRTVYDVSEITESGVDSICRVVKSVDGGTTNWAEACSSKDGTHIEAVKEWEDQGRPSPPWKGLDTHFKTILDSIRSKGPKKPHQNITHKPTPKIPKPVTVTKPKGEPQIVVDEKKGALVKYLGAIYEDIDTYLKRINASGADYERCLQSRDLNLKGKRLQAHCTCIAARRNGSKTASILDSGSPQFIKYRGIDMIKLGKVEEKEYTDYDPMMKVGTVVNYSIWDPTLLSEAKKWIASQLRKKRRVFQNTDDQMNYSLFATNLPSIERLKTMIQQKFHGFKQALPSLRELTNENELDTEPGSYVIEDEQEIPVESKD